MRTAVLVLSFLLPTSLGLYEEPPGGCQAPPDDAPFPQQRVQRQRKPMPQPKPPPPPPPPPPADQNAEIEELERQLYERESAAQLAGLGGDEEDDWEAIEKAQIWEQRKRQGLSALVVILGILFSLYKIFEHVLEQTSSTTEQPQKAPPTSSKAAAAADAPAAAPAPAPADDKAEAPAAAAPAAADDEDDDDVDIIDAAEADEAN